MFTQLHSQTQSLFSNDQNAVVIIASLYKLTTNAEVKNWRRYQQYTDIKIYNSIVHILKYLNLGVAVFKSSILI